MLRRDGIARAGHRQQLGRLPAANRHIHGGAALVVADEVVQQGGKRPALRLLEADDHRPVVQDIGAAASAGDKGLEGPGH